MDVPLPRTPNEPLFRLPNLRVLKLLESDYEYDTTSFIIDYVTLPNLRVLFFTDNWYDPNVKAEMLTSFIRRSLPPLTALVMEWYVHEGLVIPILRLLPTLKYLLLGGVVMTRRFFHELTIPSNTGTNILLGDECSTVCLVLETLFLQDIVIEEDVDSWIAFISVLESRPRGLGKLNVIYLTDGDMSTVGNLSVLDENICEPWREVKEHVRVGGVVIGNYEAIESLLNCGSGK